MRPSLRQLVVVGALAGTTACSGTPGGSGTTSSTTAATAATVTVTATASSPTTSTTTTSSGTTTTAAATGASGDWSSVVASVRRAVVRLEVASCDERWMGTGFVVGDHQILTAAHVALDAQTVSVQGEGFNGVADVVGLDRDSDSALLYTSERLPQKLAMSSTTPALGAPLALLGFPEAVSDLRVTQGIVSGLDASAEYQDIGFSLEHLVSTDAAINGGNSGGPAFNRDGKVIGLVTGKTVWTANSDPVEGTGYVVPSNQVAPHLRAWLSQRPRSGRPECENGDNAPTDDDLAINVSVVPDTTEARDIARSLVVHGESINNGNYEIAWDLFTARAKRDLGDLETWQSGLGSSYWTDLTVGSAAVRGDDATVEVALGTRQDAADGYHGQTCSVWSLTYTMKRPGAGWLIDHAKNEPGSPKACP